MLKFPLIAIGILLLMAANAQTASAQGYPSKPIRLIIAWPAGGTTDIVGRLIGQKMSEHWKQAVVIDNRGGAGGNIGTELAVKTAADGYTILLGTMGTHTMNRFLYRRMAFDSINDVTPISLVSNTASVLVAHPSLPARNVKELVALAKARPGQLNFASGSSFYQLCGEQFKIRAKINLVNIPYKGGGPAVIDLLAGHVETLFTGAPAAMSHIKSGRLRVLAVTNSKRAAALPEVPTIGETIPGYEFNNWAGIMLPAGAPRAIVDRLNVEIVRILSLPDVRAKFIGMGAEATSSTPEQFAALLQSDVEKMGKIIKAAGLSPE